MVTTNNLPTSATTITSLALTAGVWLISSLALLNGGSTVTYLATGIGLVTNSFSGQVNGYNYAVSVATVGNASVAIPMFVVSISTTTTYFLVGNAGGSATNQVQSSLNAVRIG